MFYLSSTCSAGKNLSEIIREIVDWGVKNIELSGNIPYQENLLAEIERHKEQFDLNFMFHNYFPPQKEEFVLNIASQDSIIKSKSMTLIENAFLWMDRLNIPVYGVHGGHNIDMQPVMKDLHFIVDKHTQVDTASARKSFYENLEYIMEEMLTGKGKLAIENLTPKNKDENYSLMATPTEIEQFLEFSQHYEELGLLLDLGHLNVAGHVLGFDAVKYTRYFLGRYPQKIFQLHLADNDGTFDFHKVHNPDSWQIKLFYDYFEILEEVPATFEWSHKTNSPKEIKQGIERIFKKFNADLTTSKGKKC